MGKFQVTLRELAFSWVAEALRQTPKGNSFGCVLIEHIQYLDDIGSLLTPSSLQVFASAQKLAKMDGPLGSADPFFAIHHKLPHQTRPVLLHRSEVQHKNLNPVFQPFVLNVADIGGLDAPFTVGMYDWDANGGFDTIGVVLFHSQ